MNPSSIIDIPPNTSLSSIIFYTIVSMNLPIHFITEGETLAGFSVYVSSTSDWKSGTLCYQHVIEEPLNNTVTIDCLTFGRYVTIYNSRFQRNSSSLSEFAYINICEINVTGNSLIIRPLIANMCL